MRLIGRLAALTLLIAAGRAPAEPPARAFDSAVARVKSEMMADPAAALRDCEAATKLARIMPPGRSATIARLTAEWLRGEATSRLDRPEDALSILQTAVEQAASIVPGDKLMGDLLLSRGWAEASVGKVQAALGDFQQAHNLFAALGDVRGRAKALQNIGGIYHDAGDDERSLYYYRQVADLDLSDPAIALAAHNNLGETLRTLGRYRPARAEYEKALADARRLGSPLLQAHVLTNLALAELFAGDSAKAEGHARGALALSSGSDDRAYAWGVLAAIAMKRGELEDAQAYIGRTFHGVNLATTPLPYRVFHELASRIYEKLGRHDLAYAHLLAYKRIDDSARALAASTNAALMAARFDFANQNVKITRLKAGQIARDALLVRSRAQFRQTLFAIILGAGLLVLGLMGFGLFKLGRSRNATRAANAQLSETNSTLEKALKAKTDFLATTSHEIRTPLNGILGMTQILLADRRVAPDVREKIEVVHGAGETMRSLVDDILDLAKMETGRLSVAEEPFDLARLLLDAARFWKGRAESKRLTLDADLAACPAHIVGDEGRLRQIVFNLMSNALKFTQEGWVTLAASVETVSEREWVLIRVGDSGIGIAADQHEAIFEHFYQVDSGKDRHYAGTGLGLAICRNIAHAMQGSLTVASEPGHGSVFTLGLPLRRFEAEAPAMRQGGEAGRRAESLVLLLEPNPLTQRMIAKGLKGAAGQVEAVADAGAALAVLEQRAVHTLIIQAEAAAAPDCELTEALCRLTRAAAAHGANCVILHASDGPLDTATLATLGATALLPRPLAMQTLIATLRGFDGGAENIERSAA